MNTLGRLSLRKVFSHLSLAPDDNLVPSLWSFPNRKLLHAAHPFVFTFLLLLFLIVPVLAGSWSVSYQCAGADSWTQDPHDGDGCPNAPWPTTATGSFQRGVYYRDGQSRGYIQTSSSQGSIIPVLTWVPSNASDSPPPNIFISESSTAIGASDDDQTTPTADNGLKDAPTTTMDTYNTSVTSAGTHVFSEDNSSHSATVKLPSVTVSATGGLAGEISSIVIFSVSVISPDKSIMINGPGNVYANGQWTGTGDTRFSNNESNQASLATVGDDFGPATFSASLVGNPWGSEAQFFEQLFTREWHWFATPDSAQGTSFSIDDFMVTRPHKDWPYDESALYIPKDFLDECEKAPSPETKHVNLHLTDTDTSDDQSLPWLNFDNTANYYMTFHNPNELVPGSEQVTPLPLDSNPWRKLTLAGQDANVGGYVSNWSPTVYYEWSLSGSYSFVGAGASAGINLPITPATVPGPTSTSPEAPVEYGCVYYRPLVNDINFKYMSYGVGGLIPGGFAPDGTAIPYSLGDVIRPADNTHPLEARVFVFTTAAFPDTLDGSNNQYLDPSAPGNIPQ